MNAHLTALGWGQDFTAQLESAQIERLQSGELQAVRVAEVHRSQLIAWGEAGNVEIERQPTDAQIAVAVGDWLLHDAEAQRWQLLTRRSVLERKAAGEGVGSQLIAANLDTLFVVTSCNREFNPARLERYLALALDGGVEPVLVLTKIDLCEDPEDYARQAGELRPGQVVELINSKDPASVQGVRAWCPPGQTAAMVGSSGVGKSTLATALGVEGQATGAVREGDDKGRHTTTWRSMHRLPGGGLLIDNPGVRELQLGECETGIQALFADVLDHANCKFSDCGHSHEPGCGVLAAVAEGRLEQRRLDSYRKLLAEQRINAEALAEKRARERTQGKFYKSVQGSRRRQRRGEEPQ